MNDQNGCDIEHLDVGMIATFAKTITATDIVLLASVSGDIKAVRLDEESASTRAFKRRIAHEAQIKMGSSVTGAAKAAVGAGT